MITFLPEGIAPNIDRIRNGTASNRDGHGWAIVVLDSEGYGVRIEYGHSMSAEAAIESFRLAREQHPGGPALFHSRITTGGLVDESNCHPFRVCGDSRTLLAHNGILPLDVPTGDKRSDTRLFAEDLGHSLFPGTVGNFNLNSKRGRRRLRDWLGRPNKFVILTVDPRFKRCSYIVNEDQGEWADGIWYSNGGYKPRTYGVGSSYGYGGYYSGYYAGTYKGGTGYPTYKGGTGYPKSGDKRWWEDDATVWDRLAKTVEGKPFTDKGAGPVADDDDGLCQTCEAKNAMDAQLNYCRVCFTCGDCFGDVMEEFTLAACECAWPTGTHPARKARVQSAFSPSELGDEDWPTDIGPRAIAASPDVAEGQ